MSGYSLRLFTCQVIHYGYLPVRLFTTVIYLSGYSLRLFTCQVIHYVYLPNLLKSAVNGIKFAFPLAGN